MSKYMVRGPTPYPSYSNEGHDDWVTLELTHLIHWCTCIFHQTTIRWCKHCLEFNHQKSSLILSDREGVCICRQEYIIQPSVNYWS